MLDDWCTHTHTHNSRVMRNVYEISASCFFFVIECFRLGNVNDTKQSAHFKSRRKEKKKQKTLNWSQTRDNDCKHKNQYDAQK